MGWLACGSVPNLNVHCHALARWRIRAGSRGRGEFHTVRRLTTLDVAEVLAAVEPRIRRLLEGGGLREGAFREGAIGHS
jgi:hypothetical protein